MGFRAQDPMRRVEWRVFFSKTRATRPDRCYIQIWQYAGRSNRDLVRSGDIQARFGEIRRHSRRSKRDLDHIWWDSTRFEEIQADFDDFWCRSNGFLQISANFLKISAMFAGSGDSLNRPNWPEHHPNPKPTRPSDAGGRFQVPSPSTRRRRVGSRLGPKPTRPDPWTALHIYTFRLY